MKNSNTNRVSRKLWLALVMVTVVSCCMVCALLVSKSTANANDVVSPFTKYTLTDAQLRGIASLCQQEQGTAQGAAAEASLMANHMELVCITMLETVDGLQKQHIIWIIKVS